MHIRIGIFALLFFLAPVHILLAAGVCKLFEPSEKSVQNAINKKAHWKTQSNFSAQGTFVIKNGRPYMEVSYKGRPGNGVGITEFDLKGPIPDLGSHLGMLVDGLSFEIGYEGKEPIYWHIFALSDTEVIADYGLRITSGFRHYVLPKNKWKQKADCKIDWRKVNRIRIYLYQKETAKPEDYPVIYLGSVIPNEVFKRDVLTKADSNQMQYGAELVSDGRPAAVAVLPEKVEFRGAAEACLIQFEKKLGVVFFRKTEKDVGADPGSGNYIVFSNSQDGILTRRLQANNLIRMLSDGESEARVLPNAFKRSSNILYLGGNNVLALQRVADNLLKSDDFGKRMGRYVSLGLSDTSKNALYEQAEKLFHEFSDVYAEGSQVYKKNTEAFKLLRRMGNCYHDTKDDRIAQLFCCAVDIVDKNYEKARDSLNSSNCVPSFHFPEFVEAADRFDDSPAISESKRLQLANLLCRITDDIMDFWEMQKPLEMYREQKIEFVENHYLFAAKAVIMAANYLTERFEIPRMDYNREVGKYAFLGIDSLKQQPEDAGGYQFICRMNWLEVYQKLGMDYNTPNLKYFIDFTLSQINHNGSAAGYGDCSDIFSIYGWNFMLAGVQLNNDPLCKYLLKKQVANSHSDWLKSRIGKMNFNVPEKFPVRMLGLTVFPVDRELLKYYDGLGLNENPVLNKSVFRSGYGDDDNYLLFGGMNSKDPHSHRDANCILQYTRGPYRWLTDLSYVNKAPKDHNGVVVSCNNRVSDLRNDYILQRYSFAEIDSYYSSSDNSMAILSTSLNGYGESDWKRTIFWHKDFGFWCVDAVKANKDGSYVIKRRWRVLGEVQQNDSGISVTQKTYGKKAVPSTLHISRGDIAPTRISIQAIPDHQNNGTVYSDYKYAGPLVNVIVESRDEKLSRDERIFLTDRFSHPVSTGPETEIRQIGLSAWCGMSPTPQFVSIGNLDAGGLSVDADCMFITSEKIMGIGVRKLVVNGEQISVPEDGRLFANAPTDIVDILRKAFNSAPKTESAVLQQPLCPTIRNVQQIGLKSNATALEISQNGIACGEETGDVALYSFAGEYLWRSKTQAPVTALAFVKGNDVTFLAAGTASEDMKNGTGGLFVLNGKGKEVLHKKLAVFGGVGGFVRALTSAKLKPGTDEQIVVGLRNKKVIAYDLNGNELWSQQLYHPSSKLILAADLDGDGLDEVGASELWRVNYVFSPEGKRMHGSWRLVGYDHSVLKADVDGVPSIVWGRDDSYIHCLNLENDTKAKWVSNAGGVVTGLAVTQDGRIAVANDNHRVEFFNTDGKSTGHGLCFPDSLLGLVACQGNLYTVCADGWLYRFDFQSITGKYRLGEPGSFMEETAMIKQFGNFIAVANGGALYIVENITGDELR